MKIVCAGSYVPPHLRNSHPRGSTGGEAGVGAGYYDGPPPGRPQYGEHQVPCWVCMALFVAHAQIGGTAWGMVVVVGVAGGGTTTGEVAMTTMRGGVSFMCLYCACDLHNMSCDVGAGVLMIPEHTPLITPLMAHSKCASIVCGHA